MRALLTLAILTMPGFALAQSTSDATESRRSQDVSEKRLAQLEARLEALLKEIHGLRSGTKVEEKKEIVVSPKEKGKAVELEFKLAGDEKSGGKKIVVVPDTDAKGKLEFKYQLGEFKKNVDVPSAPGAKTEKRVVVVEGGKAKTPATAHTVTGLLNQYYRVAAGEDANTVHLTRVTYTLEGGKAKALDAFLKNNAKAKVLETKLEGDKLVVTTTPDVQGTIGQLVGLMTGKIATRAGHVYFYGNDGIRVIQPDKPAAPAAPAVPTKPKKPAAPKEPKSAERDQ